MSIIRSALFGKSAQLGTITYGTGATEVQKGSGSSGTITINVPSGVANGDLMVLFLCGGFTGSNTWTTTGWTPRYEAGSAGGMSIYTRVASSEPASYTFNASNSNNYSGWIGVFKNAQFDVIGTNDNTPFSNTLEPPGVTASDNGVLITAFATSNNSRTWTTPTDMSVYESDSDGSGAGWAAFTQNVQAGATGTKSSTANGTISNPNSIQMALKPVS